MKFKIVTRCTRTGNLLKIKQSVLNSKFDIDWHILFDNSVLKDIPEDLKVWFGDDYISNQFSSRNIPLYSFKNVKCTKWSTTLDLPQFDTIKEEDRTLFFNKYNNI